MRISVDISLYPFDKDFLPPIRSIIQRFNSHPDVQVETNSMSTQIRGEYDDVFKVLDAEIRTTFEQLPKAVFAIKILNNSPDD